MSLRDDDQEVLKGFRAKLGIGRLSPIAARNGSRPQIVWTVGSKLECRTLVELLDAHPLRSRKSAEYEIWREAVQVWSAQRYGFRAGARARLAELAAHIRAARVYREPAADRPLPDLGGAHAVDHFAGFFSGEGSFALRDRNARFVIKLRRDDRALLEAFRRHFGIGTMCDVAGPEPWSPAVVWHVTGARDVLKGIHLLEKAPLLGRKARQFRAWRPGAEAVVRAVIAKSAVEATVVSAARVLLTRTTAYRSPLSPLAVDHDGAAAHSAYLDVLRAWAASTDGALGCTAYEVARRRLHPEWPQRDTLARVFGSWYDALKCAGLEDRAVRRPSAR